MNITFFIGNGFDTNLNLETKYEQFYPYFIEKASQDNLIAKELKKLDKKYSTWADLEIALGEFTDKIDVDKFDKFIDDKIELDNLLKEYLLIEQKKFSLTNEQMEKMLVIATQRLRECANLRDRDLLEKTLDKYKQEEYIYQVINFNYTDCLDKVWKVYGNKAIGSHKYGALIKNERLGQVLHIHGTLTDNEMILGVNDEEQIKNKELRNDKERRIFLIKPELNEAIGQYKMTKVREILHSSEVICLFGVSIGDTDRIWWEQIGKWLWEIETHILIIYNYEPKYSLTHPYTGLKHLKEKREAFLAKTNLTLEEQNEVMERIFIRDNEELFSLQLQN